MNHFSYARVLDALLLIRLKNKGSQTKLDSSVISTELFNKLLELGYIELVDSNRGVTITQKGNNVISFNHQETLNAAELGELWTPQRP